MECSGCVGATVSVVGAKDGKKAEHCSPTRRVEISDVGFCTSGVRLSIAISNGRRCYSSANCYGCTLLKSDAVHGCIIVPSRVAIGGRAKEAHGVRTYFVAC